MVLRQLDIDVLREWVQEGRALPEITYDGCELGAALDLACARRTWTLASPSPSVLGLVERWARKDEQLANAIAALDGVREDVEQFSAPAREFAPLGSRSSLDQDAAGFFNRFRRSLDENGGFGTLARGIASAMFEMADNAIQHSGPDEYHPVAGAMGYLVGHRSTTFAVVDLGRGVLSSLRSNSAWSALGSSKEAIEAAVMKSASRRAGQGAGHGFSDLHKALADLSGKLRFASGNAVLKLEGEHLERVVAWSDRADFPGFQLSISVSISK